MKTKEFLRSFANDIKRELLRYNSTLKNAQDNWGVVTRGEELITGITSTASGNITLDLSTWGFTSVDDYDIFTTVKNNYSAISARVWVDKQSATSARLIAITGQGDAVAVYYVIIAKGFGGGSGSGGSGGGGGTVDQTYDATSTNAQSGTAVAEALATVDGSTTFDVAAIPQGSTGANEINAVVSNKDTENARVSYIRQSDGTLPNTVNFGVKSGLGEDSFELPTKPYVDSEVGDLTALSTTAQDSLVSAVNELKYAVDGLGEPFRVKEWSANNLTATIPACSQEVSNTNIDKVVYTITDQEAVDYQVVGMIAYQLKDTSGNRINAWPVCQFTGGGQTELHVRFMCAGTSSKSAGSISAWVLLKHR